jgi:hypothetical protein
MKSTADSIHFLSNYCRAALQYFLTNMPLHVEVVGGIFLKIHPFIFFHMVFIFMFFNQFIVKIYFAIIPILSILVP